MDIKFQDDEKVRTIDSDRWLDFISKPVTILDYKNGGQTALIPVEALQSLDGGAKIYTPEDKQARSVELQKIISDAQVSIGAAQIELDLITKP